MQRIKITISGKVQGVSFRKHTEINARKLGLVGWVRNDQDGTVSVEAQGKKENLDKFLKWCASGPSGAIVESVEKQFVETSENSKEFVWKK